MDDVKGINKYIGLMFQRNPKILKFDFDKPINYPIHSLFCKKFIAIWFLNNRVVDFRIVKPFELNIKSKSEFDKLIEIPICNY